MRFLSPCIVIKRSKINPNQVLIDPVLSTLGHCFKLYVISRAKKNERKNKECRGLREA